MRFDLRSEFAALAAEPHPFAFWERSEHLAERFEHEQRRQGQPGRPAPGPDRPETAGRPSGSALSGDLGPPPEAAAHPSAAERPATELSGSSTRICPTKPSGTRSPRRPSARSAERAAAGG
ncbi:hypothetical protein ACFQ0O_00350 [Saccharopolyspora spinosporotrichia]